LVAIPLFVGIFASLILDLVQASEMMSMSKNEEERAQILSSAICQICLSLVFIILVLAFVGLLVVRLNTGWYTMPVVFVPIFMVTGFLFCCCCCCLPCMVYTHSTCFLLQFKALILKYQLCCFNMGSGIPESFVDPIAELSKPKLYIEGNKTGSPQPNWTVNLV